MESSVINTQTSEKLLKVSSSTDANKLAGSITTLHQENSENEIILRAIGAGSVNQAIKGSIIANRYFSKKGMVVDLRPSFRDLDSDITAIEFRVILRRS